MAAVTATRFDERRTTTFGAVGVAGVFVFMASLKNSLSCRAAWYVSPAQAVDRLTELLLRFGAATLPLYDVDRRTSRRRSTIGGQFDFKGA